MTVETIETMPAAFLGHGSPMNALRDIEPTLDLLTAQGLYLSPGVGAQSATPGDVARVFAACPDRVIPSASRSLLHGGPDLSRLRDTAAALATEVREVLSG